MLDSKNILFITFFVLSHGFLSASQDTEYLPLPKTKALIQFLRSGKNYPRLSVNGSRDLTVNFAKYLENHTIPTGKEAEFVEAALRTLQNQYKMPAIENLEEITEDLTDRLNRCSINYQQQQDKAKEKTEEISLNVTKTNARKNAKNIVRLKEKGNH